MLLTMVRMMLSLIEKWTLKKKAKRTSVSDPEKSLSDMSVSAVMSVSVSEYSASLSVTSSNSLCHGNNASENRR